MASPAQIEANRRNAQKSTGPRTPEGKLTVSQNALRHGICSGFARMADESDHDAQELLSALIVDNQPVGANEEILVYKMAEHFFCQQRASTLLAEEFDAADCGDKNSRELGLLLRYHTAADRGFARALNDLRKLQKERKLQEIGFVSQETEVHPAETSVEPPAVPLAEPPESLPIVPPEAAPSETLESMLRKAALRQSASRRDVPPTTVHLTVDGQTYTQPVTLKPDPRGTPSGGDAGGQ
jgi:hypothetical protein